MDQIEHLFDGRLGRKDYVISSVGLLAVAFVGNMVLWMFVHGGIFGNLVSAAWSLAIGVVHFSLSARRLHDLGQTGWLSLIMCIPFINFLFWLYMVFALGDQKENMYGPIARERIFMDMLLNK